LTRRSIQIGDQRFDPKSCGRASVTPGRNSGKVAAKSKEEKKTRSAMLRVGKYYIEKGSL